MHGRTTIATRLEAQTITFAALYIVLSFLKISPIIGLPGQTITAAAVMAPIIGIVIGAYWGATATFLGGTIGFFLGSLSYPSLMSGIITAFFAGMIREGRRNGCIFLYSSLLLIFALYPSVGPFWLFPWSLWFQVIGLVLLVSPLQSVAIRNLDSNNDSRLIYAFFISSLTSTLAGQIAGSLTFEAIASPTVTTWQVLALLYPAERIIIACFSALVGASLHRVMKSASLRTLSLPVAQ